MVTQAFSCTPLEAYRQPLPLVVEVLEARAFSEAYHAVQDYEPQDGAKRPSGPMVDAVMECEAEALAAAKERRGH